MLALQKVRPAAGLEFRTLEEPAPQAGEVVVRVAFAGICGTDIHIAAWTPGYGAMESAMPVTLGHEFAGTIERVGPGVASDAVGTRVTARPSVTCRRCAACLAADEDNCNNRKGVGIARNGAFAALVRVPYRNCHTVPEGVDLEIAALTEPMTVCAEAVATADVRAGQAVLVMGPGFIGQGIALLARARGATVVVAGRDDQARLSTLAKAGFMHLIDTKETALEDALRHYGPFDAIIEAAGVPTLVNACLPFLNKRGNFTVVGIHPKPAEIDLTQLVRMHQQIRGSYRAPSQTWDEMLLFLQQNQQVMHGLISHQLSLQEALHGFKLAQERVASKVMLRLGAGL
ncbi:zinc-dependent alcohol dehydrogenase [Rhizobium halophilum]|uniref:zinc-dependent alcohol dehydrogenase n=1 Tax=Rhizobium halophilum TaxID=2846852 RepID=UPI001EFC3B06|nr:alcohol dehydrogenase catalytic domain-containing protein [Rhizobium halophilum]MCF6370852.1 alcohol dehydrogenase catalytic domain-containing protein [Rhizobium halophilum]